MATFTRAATLAFAIVLLSGEARADYFVITATERSKERAQEVAATQGGWTLDSNLYSNLTPNRFSVVRGPYTKLGDARAMLTFLQEGGGYQGAYVKNAGTIRVSALFGGQSTPAITGALLGELRVSTTERAHGEGCEPGEPFIQVSLSFVSLVGGGGDEALSPSIQELDFGALWLIKRTGELVRARVCRE